VHSTNINIPTSTEPNTNYISTNQSMLSDKIYLGAKSTALRAHSTALGASPLMRQYMEAKLWWSQEVEFLSSPRATWWPNWAISLSPSTGAARFSSGPADKFALATIACTQYQSCFIWTCPKASWLLATGCISSEFFTVISFQDEGEFLSSCFYPEQPNYFYIALFQNNKSHTC
jgi:hypothetical protein